MAWYLSGDFWIGVGITAAIIALSYVVRIYFTKLLFWYQNWSVDLNRNSYEFGKNLRKKYDGKFGNRNGKPGKAKMHPLRKR